MIDRETGLSRRDMIDERYYQVAAPRSAGERVAIAARDRIYADFIQHCRPSPENRILDVGVSDVVNDVSNVLERKYPHPQQITALGLGGGSEFYAAFPKVAYRRIEANRPLPFADKAFDIAVSNAVLEHVGSEQHQVHFVSELARVANKIFITVPNRYFPVEHHTGIPVLHFWKSTFELACRCLDKAEWADERNLILMLRDRLAAVAPAGFVPVIGYTGIMLGMFSSNLFLFIDTSVKNPQQTP
jgi:SAM-dependent methyltransferase